jgi:hypothetical protein
MRAGEGGRQFDRWDETSMLANGDCVFTAAVQKLPSSEKLLTRRPACMYINT